MHTAFTKYICTSLDQNATEHDVGQDKKNTTGVSNGVQINIIAYVHNNQNKESMKENMQNLHCGSCNETKGSLASPVSRRLLPLRGRGWRVSLLTSQTVCTMGDRLLNHGPKAP